MKVFYLDYVRDSGNPTCYGSSYGEVQKERANSFDVTEIDEIVQWGYNDPKLDRNIVDTEFYQDVKPWFDNKMHGYYAWKPFVIYELMSRINDGDIIVYWDCNPLFPVFKKSYRPLLENFNDNYEMFSGLEMQAKHSHWTKRDCFELMKCSDKKYWKGRKQIQATWSIWKRTSNSIKIVQDWMEWCKDENVVRCDVEQLSNKPNFRGFKEHRWDQSILTNISVKHSCSVVSAKQSGWRLRNNNGKNLNWLCDNFKKCTIKTL